MCLYHILSMIKFFCFDKNLDIKQKMTMFAT